MPALCQRLTRGWGGCLEPQSPEHGAAAGASRGEPGARTEELFVLPPGRLFIGTRSCLHQLLAAIAATDTQTWGPSPGCTPRSPGAAGALLGRRGGRDEGWG